MGKLRQERLGWPGAHEQACDPRCRVSWGAWSRAGHRVVGETHRWAQGRGRGRCKLSRRPLGPPGSQALDSVLGICPVLPAAQPWDLCFGHARPWTRPPPPHLPPSRTTSPASQARASPLAATPREGELSWRLALPRDLLGLPLPDRHGLLSVPGGLPVLVWLCGVLATCPRPRHAWPRQALSTLQPFPSPLLAVSQSLQGDVSQEGGPLDSAPRCACSTLSAP